MWRRALRHTATSRSRARRQSRRTSADQSMRSIVLPSGPRSVLLTRVLLCASPGPPRVGNIYPAKVTSVMPYGAFCDLAGGTSGLIHISQLDVDGRRLEAVNVAEGERVFVSVLSLDGGKISLSRRQISQSTGRRIAPPPPKGEPPSAEQLERPVCDVLVRARGRAPAARTSTRWRPSARCGWSSKRARGPRTCASGSAPARRPPASSSLCRRRTARRRPTARSARQAGEPRARGVGAAQGAQAARRTLEARQGHAQGGQAQARRRQKEPQRLEAREF